MDNVNLDLQRSNGKKQKTNRVFLTPIRGNKHAQRPKEVQRLMGQSTARTPAQVLAANARVVPFGDLTTANMDTQSPPVANCASVALAKEEIDNVGLDDGFTPAHRRSKDAQVQPLDMVTDEPAPVNTNEIAPLASVKKETKKGTAKVLTAANDMGAQVQSVIIDPAEAAPASNTKTLTASPKPSNSTPPLPPPSTLPKKASFESSPSSSNVCTVPEDEETVQWEMSPEIAKTPQVFAFC